MYGGGFATIPAFLADMFGAETRTLALAIHFDEMIQKGDATDYADIARQTCLCRERVSQIARLNYLAPDIQMELLYLPPVPTGRYPISETAMRMIASLLSWTINAGSGRVSRDSTGSVETS